MKLFILILIILFYINYTFGFVTEFEKSLWFHDVERSVPNKSCLEIRNKDKPEYPLQVQPLHWGFIYKEMANLSDGTVIHGLPLSHRRDSFACSSKISTCYIHIHKAAGASFRFGLFKKTLCPDSQSLQCSWKTEDAHVMETLQYARYNQMFKMHFSFVRCEEQFKQTITFSEFAKDPSMFHNYCKLDLIHLRPQFYSLIDQTGHFIVNFLGRVETLDKDLPLLLEYINNRELISNYNREGLGSAHSHHKFNLKEDKYKQPPDWRDVYNNNDMNNIAGDKNKRDYELINVIYCQYKTDIELFGYNFERTEVTVKPLLNKRSKNNNNQYNIINHNNMQQFHKFDNMKTKSAIANDYKRRLINNHNKYLMKKKIHYNN